MRPRYLSALLVCAPFFYACSDSSTDPGAVGSLTQLSIRAGGDMQRALAGTALPGPIVIVPEDQAGRTVVNQTATFSVTAGGGSLSNSTGQTNADGTITAPTWTLGKTDVPQEMTVNVAGRTTLVTASVQTAYVLTVRFFGAPISTPNQALFTTAAARVRGFIVGAVPPVNMTGAAMEFCTGPGSAALAETVNGLLIFAAVDSIDGPASATSGQTLAQAGPCYFRSSTDFRTIVGLMQFDSADIGQLVSSGQLQDVITHEMMHVVGLGAYWGPSEKNLIVNSGAPGAGYTGAGGIAGCQASGGTVTCSSSVPVEDCVGIPPMNSCGAGQLESHWKETTFTRELMTAYLNSGANPLSVMSIRSFEDLDYTVNTAAADAYNIAAISSLRMASDMASSPTLSRRWERRLSVRPRPFPAAGNNSSDRR